MPGLTPWEQGSALAWQLKPAVASCRSFPCPVRHCLLWDSCRAHSWRRLFLPSPHPPCPMPPWLRLLRGVWGTLGSHGEEVLALLTVSRRSTVEPLTFS